ncbi:MAG: hypothetical protein JXR12_15080 [Neptunomonas phycophila]|uniref:hypothetical protein n=1 Tax=Neptunomonas phycophila TaxID=1572645 RepID=UPI003B8BBDCA
MSEPIVSGKRVAKLMYVAVNDGNTKQSNKYYNMYEQGDGTFIAEWGRVDVTKSSKTYPMSKWDSTIKSKTSKSKGYKDVTHLFEQAAEESEGSDIADIQNTVVKKLMDQLQAYANNSVQQNYTVSSRAVTQAMVDDAQDKVTQLKSLIKQDADVEAINALLLELYHIIPRRMNNVHDHLLSGKTIDTTDKLEHAEKVIADEQDTLDVMAGQVIINKQEDEAKDEQEEEKPSQDILSIMGIEMEEASADDIEIVKKQLGPNAHQFRKAYKVKHKATQAKFDDNLAKADNKQVELFWHGSRNQNWLNILSTGLLIRPSGAIHTGSMFGDGIYFADKAQKSIGYTSLRGSYWASGGDNNAYLALFSVHVGEQKHIKHHNSSCYSLNKAKLEAENCDSVFAHGGADLRNNEYIVYDSSQCTVSYLVEIGN